MDEKTIQAKIELIMARSAILAFMDEFKMSRSEFAKLSGVNRRSIDRFLRGQDIYLFTFLKLAFAIETHGKPQAG